MATLITGGTVVNAHGPLPADVLVDGETVAGLAAPGSAAAAAWAASAERVIDAAGQYVIPGGVDPHTHMEMPFGGTQSADTFETGTRAAAFGGTTTIVDFAIQTKGTSLRDGLDTWHAKADGQCAIDYGFHMIISDVNDVSMKEMDVLVDSGVTSFKLFMAYPGVFYSDDGEILQAMQRASANGATIMMHAENGIAIDVLVAQALARGETDPRTTRSTRPSILEGEATHRAIALAQVAGAPRLLRPPLGRRGARRGRARARRRPERLRRDLPAVPVPRSTDLARPGFEGAKYVCSPPLRPEPATRPSSGAACAPTTSRSCRPTTARSASRARRTSARATSRKIPNGLPGVEHRVELLYQGVVAGELSLGRWVEIVSTTPARLFGSTRARASIAPAADADLVVFDPNCAARCRPRPITWTSTTRPTRAARSPAARRPC